MKRIGGLVVGLAFTVVLVGALAWWGIRHDEQARGNGSFNAPQAGSQYQSATDTVLASDPHSPQAHVVQLDAPVDIQARDQFGKELIVEPASPDATDISAQEAVDVAWKNDGDLSASSVTAEFGLLQGHPMWLVAFDGVCVIGPGRSPAPGAVDSGVAPTPSCITRLTARIDGETGQWIESYG